MVKAGAGKIINIGSIMSIFGAPYAPAYCASKGGDGAVHQVARHRLGQGQHPGEHGAARLDRHRADARRAVQVPGLYERVLARTPAGRWGVPEDLAGIAVFLASKASDFVTGTAIPVDGGYASS
jgi:2-deoxy-D-gluconate 3-dehydrogenase